MNLIPVLLLSSKLVYFLPLLWTTFPDGAHTNNVVPSALSQTLSFLALAALVCSAGVDLLFWISTGLAERNNLGKSTRFRKEIELSQPFMKEYSETLKHLCCRGVLCSSLLFQFVMST